MFASDITDKTRNNFSASIQNKQIDDKNKREKIQPNEKETKQIISLDVVYLVTLEQIIPKKRLIPQIL